MIHLDDLLAATGGRLAGTAAVTSFSSFCYDSRLVQPGQLFLAIRTDRADGHDYIADALRGGATGVLCQRPLDTDLNGASCIVVPDTRQAIQEWARFILAKQAPRIVGITGSVGKTTTKEAVAAVLGGSFPVFKNRANYNGLYGLPIALGELLPEHRVAVMEMAADHFGEMARLCAIAPPHVAVVTTVEPAHLETFGSLEAIAREKGELVAALSPGGLAVLNADDPRVLGMAARCAPGVQVMTFGTTKVTDTGDRRSATGQSLESAGHVSASNIIVTREGLRFDVETPAGRDHVHFPLLGRHQVYAALAAIAVGLHFGMDLAAILPRLAQMPHIPGRLNPLPGRRGSLLLDDSYSSSPAAAEAALETLAAVEGRRKIAVLGDMLELGAGEAAGHEQVGQIGGASGRSAGDQRRARPADCRGGARRRDGRRPDRHHLHRRGCGAGRARPPGAGRCRAGQRLARHPHGAGDARPAGGRCGGRRRARAAGCGLAAHRHRAARPAHLAGDRPGRDRPQRPPAEAARRRRSAHDLAQGGRLRSRRDPGGADRAAQRRVVAGGGLSQRGRRVTSSGHRRPDPDPGLHAGLAGARRLAP